MKHLVKLKRKILRIKEKRRKKKQDQLFLIEVLIVCQKILEDIWKMKNCFLKYKKKKKKKKKKIIQKIEHLKEEEYNDESKNKEYRKLLNNKDYQDYLNYQKNRANYVNNVQTVEGFSNFNDNFNDVLLFGLLGIFFLIFTDYIYKLGKRSY